MTPYVVVYWRFKGDKGYRFGWPSPIAGKRNLFMMGVFVGDHDNGPIVDLKDIELR